MKLIYISTARIPTEKAHGIQIIKTCEAFSSAGAEVNLVLPWRFNPIKNGPFEYYGVEKNFNIKKIPSLDLARFGKIGFLIQYLSFSELATYYALFKKADIIYSRDVLPLFYLTFFGKKNLFWEAHEAKKNFMVKRVLDKSKKVITISQGLKDYYVNNYAVSPEKIIVAPDGVDITRYKIQDTKYKIRDRLGLPIDKKIAMYAGSFYLYGWKGIDVLLEAANKFKSQISNLKTLFILVGGNKKEIEEIKSRYNLENLMLLEHKLPKEIPYYLKSADVLVLPNKKGEDVSEKYTSPLKLFEYMASGLPIVASNLPSIREILNEKNAVLVEPNNPKALAEGIRKVLENTDLATKISQQSLKDIQNYTWQKRVKKILNLC